MIQSQMMKNGQTIIHQNKVNQAQITLALHQSQQKQLSPLSRREEKDIEKPKIKRNFKNQVYLMNPYVSNL